MYLGAWSPMLSGDLPGCGGRATTQASHLFPLGRGAHPYLVLLRVGFAKPPRLPEVLVGSYPTLSPLPP